MIQVGSDIWKLQAMPTVSPTPISTPASANAYPMLSSGQLGIVPIVDAATGTMDVACTLFPGASSSKCIDSVKTVVESLSTEDAARVATAMTFDMKTASFSMTRAANMGESMRGDGLRVTHTVCVLQHMPSVVMHRISVQKLSAQPLTDTLRLEHEIRGSSEDATLEFSGMIASGAFISHAAGDESCCAVAFRIPPTLTLVDLPAHAEPAVSRAGKRRAVSTLLLQPDGQASVAEIVVYSSTQGPTKNRAGAAKRAVLSALAVSPATHAARHAALWDEKWKTFVDVPSGASSRVRSALTYAMYNMHVRTHEFPAMNSAGAQGRSEDFITPALVYVSPEAARQLLDRRAGPEEQDAAREAAELEGLAGVRYPYGPAERRQAVLGVADGGRLDMSQMASQTPAAHGLLRIHATTMTAINAWNYYRTVGSLDWLSRTGFSLISQAADLVSSLAVSSNGGTTYSLVGVVAMTDTTSDPMVRNSSLAVAGSIAALRAACEASYALGYQPKQLWLDVRFGLSLPKLTSSSSGAALTAPLPLARHSEEDLPADLADAAEARALGGRIGQQAPEEVLLVLAEPLGTMIEADLGFNIISNISRNYATWAASAVVEGLQVSSHPGKAVRRLIRLLSMAQAMQVDATLADSFSGSLDAFLDAHSDLASGGFGNLSKRLSGGSASHDVANDAELSALLLLVFICGVGGGMVQGGYGESGMEYATLGVSLGTSAVMPGTWERLLLRGMGGRGADAVLLNRGVVGTVVDTGGDAGDGGVVVGPSDNLIYWSTDTLTL